MAFRTVLATVVMSSIAHALNTNTLSAFLPGSSLHGQTVAAYGQSYYFGITTSSFCPDTVSSCPAGTETVFYPGLESLNVEVPGGEANYVTTDGRFGFTAPHSTSTPLGSVTPSFGNWTYQNTGPIIYSYNNTLIYTYNNTQAPGSVLACPYNNNGTVFQQLYVKVAGFNRTDCTELAGLLGSAFSNGDYGAWEYA